MNVNRLNQLMDLLNEMMDATARLIKVRNVQEVADMVGKGKEYIRVYVAGEWIEFEKEHFLKFLEVEAIRAERRVDELVEKLEKDE